MSVSGSQATEIAAFVAAGASLLGIAAQYRLTRRNELTKWQREHLLPTLARLLTLSKENKDHLANVSGVSKRSPEFSPHLEANVAQMRGLAEEISLLAPGLAGGIERLFSFNVSAVKAFRQGESNATLDGWSVRIGKMEDAVTSFAQSELGLHISLRRRIARVGINTRLRWIARKPMVLGVTTNDPSDPSGTPNAEQ